MADRGKDWKGLTEMDDEGWPGSVSPRHPLSSFLPSKIFDSQALVEFVYSCQPLSALVSHFWSLSILTTLCQFLQDFVSPREPWSEILSSGEPLLSSVISGHQILVSGSPFPFQSLKSWISSSNLLIIFYHSSIPRRYTRGDTEQNFVRGGSTPRTNPLTFHRPFWQKWYPFRILFVDKWYPFHKLVYKGASLLTAVNARQK